MFNTALQLQLPFHAKIYFNINIIYSFSKNTSPKNYKSNYFTSFGDLPPRKKLTDSKVDGWGKGLGPGYVSNI
jgi:hypothetical protein